MRPLSVAAALLSGVAGAATIIDHTCTDLEDVPSGWIETVRTMDSQYAHTSHGSQLTGGAEFLEEENPFYDISIGACYLPQTPGVYCVFDGQEGVGYITPDLYWETAGGLDLTRDVLDHNPTISTSMWSWCTQCDYYSEAQVQAYLDAMSLLESEYPSVSFVYLTGNAQNTGSSGYNRWMRNQQIRNYCLSNDKILFDFEDLDCWWFNPSSQQWEQHTYSYGGYLVPSEHPQFYGDEYGHTTVESCIQKGRAWWYMMALIAGWGGMGIPGDGEDSGTDLFHLGDNPVAGAAAITLSPGASGEIDLAVFDMTGRLVARLFSGVAPDQASTFGFDPAEPGIYLVRCESGCRVDTGRLAVLS